MNSIRKQLRRAVSRLRRRGLEGDEPLSELQFLGAHRDGLDDELRAALASAADEDVAPLIRIARLLRRDELTSEVAAAALQRPAPLVAKEEAIAALQEWGVGAPEPVTQALGTARALLFEPNADTLDAVLELPDAWRLAAVREWLASTAVATAAMLERVLGTADALDEAVVARLGRSGDPDAAPLLRRILQDAGPELTKRVRRALHQLRAAGVDVSERDEQEETFSFEIRPDTVTEAQSWVTGVDGDGGRIAWLLTPTPTGGDRLLEVVLDAGRGVRRAELLSVRRRDLRSHLEGLRDRRGIVVARLPVPEVAAMLQQAEEITREGGSDLPPAYRSWREDAGVELLAVADPEATDRALSQLGEPSADEVRQRLRESVELLGDAAFQNWAVFGDAARRAAEGVRRAETSKIVVDEDQRKQAVDAAIASVAEVFDEPTRQAYRRRLRGMARALQAVGREEEARKCLAAGQGFLDLKDLYSEHPFARAIMQRGVLVAYQAVRDSEGPDADEQTTPGG